MSTIASDQAEFKVTLDTQHFNREDLKVKTLDNYIVIEGSHEEKDPDEGGGVIERQFTRKYLLPEGIKADEMTSELSPDGVLTIRAPKLPVGAVRQAKEIPIKKIEQPTQAQLEEQRRQEQQRHQHEQQEQQRQQQEQLQQREQQEQQQRQHEQRREWPATAPKEVKGTFEAKLPPGTVEKMVHEREEQARQPHHEQSTQTRLSTSPKQQHLPRHEHGTRSHEARTEHHVPTAEQKLHHVPIEEKRAQHEYREVQEKRLPEAARHISEAERHVGKAEELLPSIRELKVPGVESHAASAEYRIPQAENVLPMPEHLYKPKAEQPPRQTAKAEVHASMATPKPERQEHALRGEYERSPAMVGLPREPIVEHHLARAEFHVDRAEQHVNKAVEEIPRPSEYLQTTPGSETYQHAGMGPKYPPAASGYGTEHIVPKGREGVEKARLTDRPPTVQEKLAPIGTEGLQPVEHGKGATPGERTREHEEHQREAQKGFHPVEAVKSALGFGGEEEERKPKEEEEKDTGYHPVEKAKSALGLKGEKEHERKPEEKDTGFHPIEATKSALGMKGEKERERKPEEKEGFHPVEATKSALGMKGERKPEDVEVEEEKPPLAERLGFPKTQSTGVVPGTMPLGGVSDQQMTELSGEATAPPEIPTSGGVGHQEFQQQPSTHEQQQAPGVNVRSQGPAATGAPQPSVVVKMQPSGMSAAIIPPGGASGAKSPGTKRSGKMNVGGMTVDLGGSQKQSESSVEKKKAELSEKRIA